ncbi:hypothetical protein, partial [Nostoc sp.]|uniref:hypothetical protein n=1 Tax=Nostoc sp. TaxID=1180 RepID=UPI002FF4A046
LVKSIFYTAVVHTIFFDLSSFIYTKLDELTLPGEEEKYTGEDLKIQFNSTCRIGCTLTTPPQSLQPGKRYQFKFSPISGGEIIQLVDFPR